VKSAHILVRDAASFGAGLAFALLGPLHAAVHAHSGPPYPIVSNRVLGAYSVSIWTDPDTTDNGSPAGQFWIELEPADGKAAIPAGTRATVAIRPLDREGPTREGRADPVKGNVARQFIALLMDHEGPFGVHLTIEGPLGRATVDSQVDATYDLRPARWLIALYLFPFVAIGALWGKVLLRRRRRRA
jgi:hypothetical protein